MKEHFRKAKAILLYSWKDFFEYRGYLLFWVIVGSQSFLMMYFLWMFIYRDQKIVSGYSLSAMITYYFVAYFVKELTNNFFDWNISIKIKEGMFSHFFYRPLSHRTYYFYHNIGEKMIRFFVLSPVFVAFYLLVKDYLIVIKPALILPLLVSFALSFLISVYFTYIVGYIAFWTEKSETLIYFKDSLVYYLSGAMVPLVFFGPDLAQLLRLLPFRYLVSFPVEIYLGKLTAAEISYGYVVAFVWLIVFMILDKVIFKAGARRFSAVGN